MSSINIKIKFIKPRIGKKPPIGLGDVMAIVAQPVAKVIDKVAGTKLVNCSSCNDRKDVLNAVMPDIAGTAKAVIKKVIS